MENIKTYPNINTEYYIDDDNQIYILSQLCDGDKVKCFLEDNLTKITKEEIEYDMSEIREDFEESGYGNARTSWYGEPYYDYEENEDYVNLQDLLEKLDEAIAITHDDRIYNKFLEEMRAVYGE